LTKFHAELFSNFIQNLETREVQNIELLLPVKQSRTIRIFYSFTAGEWSLRSAVWFLECKHCFAWGREVLTVGVWSQNWGNEGLSKTKTSLFICNANANSPEATNSEFHIFAP